MVYGLSTALYPQGLSVLVLLMEGARQRLSITFSRTIRIYMILNENLHFRKGGGTDKIQDEHVEPNSPVFPRSRLLPNLSQEYHITTWGRTKGLIRWSLWGTAFFPLPFSCWRQSCLLTWWLSTLRNVQEPVSISPHLLHPQNDLLSHHFYGRVGKNGYMPRPIWDHDLCLLISRNYKTLVKTQVLEPLSSKLES